METAEQNMVASYTMNFVNYSFIFHANCASRYKHSTYDTLMFGLWRT